MTGSDTTRRTMLGAGAGLAVAWMAPTAALAQELLRIRDLYENGVDFSERAVSLDGQEVIIQGFMAPPLKPDATFFVLTKLPMAVCPFCSSEAEWPTDIVMVQLDGAFEPLYFNVPIEVRGRLDLGTEVDADTGFVSRVRIVDARYDSV